MSEQSITANQNFIENGAFLESLEGTWTINDRTKATIATEQWNGASIRHLRLVNEGTAEQIIQLADLPRPTTGRAVYRVGFWYQATQGAVCEVVITPGLGGEQKHELAPSLTDESISESEPEEPKELFLQYRSYDVELESEETRVTVKFTSPINAQPGLPRGLRVTWVTFELCLEDLQLRSWSLEGKDYMPTDSLRLPWGAKDSNAFKFVLKPEAGSVWNGTNVGLLVDERTEDPEKIISTSPGLGVEQSIDEQWLISCEDGEGEDNERVMHVRSRYTAELYVINVLLGNYRLDVVAVLEAAYYPVIDLDQSVRLTVRVQSHYTQKPMTARWVTWRLGADELHGELSDEHGESSLFFKPDEAGLLNIVASVDSHYYKEEAKCTLKVLALQEDPWLEVKFGLDANSVSPRPYRPWGEKEGYPNRGSIHSINMEVLVSNPIYGTDIAMFWLNDPDSPDGLGVAMEPELGLVRDLNASNLGWKMTFGNKKNGQFGLYLKCSKLLEASPVNVMKLAHNWLKKGSMKEASRFPSEGGPSVPLQFQVLPGVETVPEVRGVPVEWKLEETSDHKQTGEEGRSDHFFEPEKEGAFTVTATALSRYDDQTITHKFLIRVLKKNPWPSLTELTMNEQVVGNTELVCLREEEGVLRLKLVGDSLEGQAIYLAFPEGQEDVGLAFCPLMAERRQLTEAGLEWDVTSSIAISASFQLKVCCDMLDPWTVPCLLVSSVLEDEGSLQLDEQQFVGTNGAFPCLGGKHDLLFLPNPGSPLLGKQVTLKRGGQSSEELGDILTPEGPQTVESSGVKWTVDCTNSVISGDFSQAPDFADLSLTYQSISMSLGHNRLDIVEPREATIDPVVGESVRLGVKVLSHYTQQSESGLEVFFNDAGAQTRADGWALCDYSAEEAGPHEVSVIPRSPYYGDQYPEPTQLTFETLATDPWLDAIFQLDDGLSDMWGKNTGFPRRGKTHTVKLILNAPNSPLIGREVSLAWTGTSPAELGITVSDAALGVARVLTKDGLSWRLACGDIKNGSFALHLVASRLLKKSPANAMSLGSTPAIAELSLIAKAGHLEISGN